MTVPESALGKVAVVGLGPVGSALARGLQAVKSTFVVVGHDRSPERAKAAAAAGVVDKITWSLLDAVDGADLVLVAETTGETLDTLAVIGPHLKPGSVVSDTAPVKAPIMAAAAEALAPNVSFVGGHPVVSGSDLASLAGATYVLVPAANADPAAVDLMDRLVRALGAKPYSIDAGEHDALAAAVSTLPGLLAAALVCLAGSSPSVRDLRRLAPTEFLALGSDAGAVADHLEAARQNKAAVDVWLAGLERQIAQIRRELAQEAAGGAFAAEVAAAAAAWNQAGDPRGESPAFEDLDRRGLLAGLLLGRRRR